MGTRCLTRFYDECDGTIICCLYRQYDGDLEEHGVELAKFLANKKLVNYISGDKGDFNGMGDVAILTVHHFKSSSMIGGFYLVPSDSDEEYIYNVLNKKGNIIIECLRYEVLLFRGTPEDLLNNYPKGD